MLIEAANIFSIRMGNLFFPAGLRLPVRADIVFALFFIFNIAVFNRAFRRSAWLDDLILESKRFNGSFACESLRIRKNHAARWISIIG